MNTLEELGDGYRFSLHLNFELHIVTDVDDKKAEKAREAIMEMLCELDAIELPLGFVRDRPHYQINPVVIDKLLSNIKNYSKIYNKPSVISLMIE